MKNLATIGIILFGNTLVGTLLADSIIGSGHDLGGQRTNDNSQICVYCHTPHHSDQITALWNRVNPAESYVMYDSPTQDMLIASAPQQTSLVCLSCHDGTIALDALLNPPADLINTTDTLEGRQNLGTNLSVDHPISISYDEELDLAFMAPVNGILGGSLPLYGDNTDQLECATCHAVHDPKFKPFLRISNSSSMLCLICHKK